MMRPRAIKRVAIILLLFVAVAGILGYDYIFDQNLPPGPGYHTLDWRG